MTKHGKYYRKFQGSQRHDKVARDRRAKKRELISPLFKGAGREEKLDKRTTLNKDDNHHIMKTYLVFSGLVTSPFKITNCSSKGEALRRAACLTTDHLVEEQVHTEEEYRELMAYGASSEHAADYVYDNGSFPPGMEV